MESQGKYGESPFLYPVYGLGGLPESFSRLCAIHGGTYMLNAKIDGIEWESGKVAGVKIDGQFAKAPMVICDPSYVTGQNKTKVTGRVIRAICIMDHPIANTNNSQSIQIILPQKQLGRKSDIYISMVSAAHNVCRQGLYLAIASATVETNDPQAELKPAMDLIGETLDVFI
jgi:Rab GDP dissociation inhibitor